MSGRGRATMVLTTSASAWPARTVMAKMVACSRRCFITRIAMVSRLIKVRTVKPPRAVMSRAHSCTQRGPAGTAG